VRYSSTNVPFFIDPRARTQDQRCFFGSPLFSGDVMSRTSEMLAKDS
jgi:hypothetical protein